MSGDRLASLINLDLLGANLFPRLGNQTGFEPGDQIQMVAKYRTQFDEGSQSVGGAAESFIPVWRRRRR